MGDQVDFDVNDALKHYLSDPATIATPEADGALQDCESDPESLTPASSMESSIQLWIQSQRIRRLWPELPHTIPFNSYSSVPPFFLLLNMISLVNQILNFSNFPDRLPCCLPLR